MAKIHERDWADLSQWYNGEEDTNERMRVKEKGRGIDGKI